MAFVLGFVLVVYQPSSNASTEELEVISMGFFLAPMLAAAGISLLAVAGTALEPADPDTTGRTGSA